MFCRNCGSQLPDNAAFCGNCGTKVEAQAAPQPAYEAPQPQVTPVVAPARPQEDPELNSLAKNTLIMGIIGLALSELGLPGLIISNIALNKAAEFERKAGKLFGKAKVGRNLAKPGKIVGLVFTIFWPVYFFIIILAAVLSAL